LRRAFGDPPPPPSKCVWPPAGIAKMEAEFRLRRVRDFLQECGGLIRNVVREIKAAQVAVGASGLNMRDSWIIPRPLDVFMMGGSSVTEIVKSAPAEDAALEKVINKISVARVKLKGKIASLPPLVVKPDGGEGGGGAGPKLTGKKKKRGRRPDTDPKADKRIAEAWATGQYKKFKDLDTAMKLGKGQAKLAVDRHRHRQRN
jgi:hypothetical protein